MADEDLELQDQGSEGATPIVETTVLDDARAAFEAVKAGDTGDGQDDAQAEAKPADRETEERTRRADGKFAAKPADGDGSKPGVSEGAAEGEQSGAAVAYTPPGGWSIAAKAEYDKLPKVVQEAIAFRETEMHVGMKRYEGLGKYAERAERNGRTLKAAFDSYVAIEDTMERDPLAGIEQICQHYGISPKSLTMALGQRYQISQGAIGQQPQQAPQQQPMFDPAQIEQRIYQNIEQRRQMADAQSQLSTFSSDPKNKYFANVQNEMGVLLERGLARDLADAYDKACYMHPEIRAALSNEQRQNGQQRQQQAVSQARLAAKAVTGGPVSGSIPGNRQYNPNATVLDDTRAALDAVRERA